MVQKITADIADDVFQWLDTVAQTRGASIEETAAQAVADAYARSAQLSWQEQDVLDIFKQRNTRPNQAVPFRSLQVGWGTKGPGNDLVAALNSLETKGLVINSPGANPPATAQSELTQAGYQHP
jgi:hypothetical protein